jgi:hypothetical protein
LSDDCLKSSSSAADIRKEGMSTNDEIPFIFFLTLEETLPAAFYTFDRQLKTLGFMLVPVRVDQLQSLLAAAEQTQTIVLCSVSNSQEMKSYEQRIRKFLKFLLKSKSITFMLLTSFERLSDVKHYRFQKNYFLLKYPLDAAAISAKIIRYHRLKSSVENVRWPGGKRAGLKPIAV